MNILCDVLMDGILAAIAAVGFAAISNPPKQSFLHVPILAAIGHMLRFCLMQYLDAEIAFATFLASMLIGFICIPFAYRVRIPSFFFPCTSPYDTGHVCLPSIIRSAQFHEND